MSNVYPEHLTHLVREALELSHQRGLLLTGGGALRQAPPQSSFTLWSTLLMTGSFPGWPLSFIMEELELLGPVFAQVFQLGASPGPLTHRTLTAAHLAQAIEQAVHDTPLREHAAQLGAQIRAEQRVVQAVEIFEQTVIRNGSKRRAKNASG